MAGHGEVCPATESRHSKQFERGRVAIRLSRRAGRGRGNEKRGPAVAPNGFSSRNKSAATHSWTESNQSQFNCLSGGRFRRGFETETGERVPGERGQGDMGRAIEGYAATSRSAVGPTGFSRNFWQRISSRTQH